MSQFDAEYCIIADDLTGSMDTAAQYANQGYSTIVTINTHTNVSPTEDIQIVAVDTETRYTTVQNVIERLHATIGNVNANVYYKKVDSTLRGHPALESQTLCQHLPVTGMLIAPAFPDMGRTTDDGIHYVNGVRVTDTFYGDDPAGPSTANLLKLFGTTGVQTTHLTEDIGAGETDELMDWFQVHMESESFKRFVCDVTTEKRLQELAVAARDLPLLFVGSAGLARYMSPPTKSETQHPNIVHTNSKPLTIAGSINNTTIEQIKMFDEGMILETDSSQLIHNGSDESVADEAICKLRAYSPVVITTAATTETVDETIQYATSIGLSSGELRNQIAQATGRMAKQIISERAPGGLLLTGGATGAAVLAALGTSMIQLTGVSIEQGVPLGIARDGLIEGMPIATKAGGFGGPTTMLNVMNQLASYNEHKFMRPCSDDG